MYVSVNMCVNECVCCHRVCRGGPLSVYVNGCVCAGVTVSESGFGYPWPA